jgi:hypothetical protein
MSNRFLMIDVNKFLKGHLQNNFGEFIEEKGKQVKR